MAHIVKRRLREEKSVEWELSTPAERLEAVETINRLKEPHYAEQAFPRVYRIARKAKR